MREWRRRRGKGGWRGGSALGSPDGDVVACGEGGFGEDAGQRGGGADRVAPVIALGAGGGGGYGFCGSVVAVFGEFQGDACVRGDLHGGEEEGVGEADVDFRPGFAERGGYAFAEGAVFVRAEVVRHV